MSIKNFYKDEPDFTKQLSQNKCQFRSLLKVCNIEYDGDIETYIEKYTGDTSVGSGRFDIFEENSMTLVEAQLDKFDFDHINRATDYALSLEVEYEEQVNHIIYITDGDVSPLVRAKLLELNEGSRNHYLVKVFPYRNHQGQVDLNFTLIDGPQIIKERKLKKTSNTVSNDKCKSSMIQSSASEPWRTDKYLNKINHIPFYGSVGSGVDSLRYWVMRVGEMWVSSDSHVHHSANGCMKQVRTSSFIKLYGEPRKPNLNFWEYHKDSNGDSIDNLLKKYFEESN